MPWPYERDARWHLFAFEVAEAELHALRHALRAKLLWHEPVDLAAAMRALVGGGRDLGLGGAYDSLRPIRRMLDDNVDPFEPMDLLFPSRLIEADFPVHVDAALWSDELGPVSYAAGDGFMIAAQRIEAVGAAGTRAFAGHCRELGERGAAGIAFVARNGAP